ncbi:MAG: DsbA family protein [Nannocystaceae bacterium]|nr:thioredoxin domain-containing protein [bacterium]
MRRFFVISCLLFLGCHPSRAGVASMQERMAALEQEQAALRAELEAARADQRSIEQEADTAAIERRRARSAIDDISGRVTELEAAKVAQVKPDVRPGRPDPDARYAATIGDAHTKGPADALVTIVMFSDFQCPFCGRANPTLDKIVKEYGKDVRIVYKHNPLPFHQKAVPAALASEAAGRQGKFWKMHDLLFDNQRALEDDDLLRYAKKLRLDRKRFRRDLKDQGLAQKVEDHQKQAAKLGARGTPSFFINGRFLQGAQPFDRFAELIDAELAHAKGMVEDGTKRREVYDALMANARPSV